MTVRTYQLTDLVESWILLSNTRIVPDENGFPVDIEGEVEYIGDSKGRWAWVKQHPNIEVMVVPPHPYEGHYTEEE